jgi:hypothetical protein
VQARQDPRGVRQVADDLALRSRAAAHERGDREDVVAAGQRRALDQVDDLDLVAAREMLLAEPLEVDERAQRLR